MRTLTLTLAGALLCAVALAGDANVPGQGGQDPAGGKWSRARYDQLLGRLGLTDEQIAKIDAIYTEYDGKVAEFRKTLQVAQPNDNGGLTSAMPKEAWAKFRDKQKELYAERDVKVMEVLTAEQKKKFEAGTAIVTEFGAKLQEVNAEYPKIQQQHKGDREKLQQAFKELSARRLKVQQEQDTQLDEKVGKLPPRPAGQNPGGVFPGQGQGGLRNSSAVGG